MKVEISDTSNPGNGVAVVAQLAKVMFILAGTVMVKAGFGDGIGGLPEWSERG
jgi:hypothetical protein